MKDYNLISALGNKDVTNRLNLLTEVNPDVDYLEHDEYIDSGSVGSYAGYELSFTLDYTKKGGVYGSFIPTQKPKKILGISEEFDE